MLPLDLPSLRFRPWRYRPDGIGSWSGHIPFAADLVASLRPAVFVELGAYYGESYFAFCQAIAESKIGCRCYAVDSWRGDEHTGSYGEEVLEEVKRYNSERYGGFSTLLPEFFDTAASRFPAGSIALLHIDGAHAYEAVRHDFYRWLPKVQPGGIVLLHDISVEKPRFGVRQFWAELEKEFRTFAFRHSNGLGVLLNSGPPPEEGIGSLLFDECRAHPEAIRAYYELCATRLECAGLQAGQQWEVRARLYWRSAGEEFSEPQSTWKYHRFGTESSTLRLRLPATKKGIEQLRLDLSDEPILLRIWDVSVSDAAGQLLWQGRTALASAIAEGVEFFPDQDGSSLLANITSNDCSMLLPLDSACLGLLTAGGTLEVRLCGIPVSTMLQEISSQLRSARTELGQAIRMLDRSRAQTGPPGLAQREELLRQREAEMKGCTEALSEAQRLVAERDTTLREYAEALSRAEEIVRQRESEVKRYAEALSEAQRLVAERDASVREYAAGLSNADEIARRNQAEARRYAEALGEAQQLVAERDTALREHAAALSHAEEIARQREAEVKRYAEALSEAQRLLAERDTALREHAESLSREEIVRQQEAEAKRGAEARRSEADT